MVVLGIDPGATGAVAFIPDPVTVVTPVQMRPGAMIRTVAATAVVVDLPTVERTVNKRTRRVIDTMGLWSLVKHASELMGEEVTHAVLEQVGPMPDEGVHSAAVFGRYLGYCEMALVAAGIPWEFVTPQKWKREFGLLGQPKDASRAVASRLFPTVDLSLKKHHGRADALLIAEWGRRQLAARGVAA